MTILDQNRIAVIQGVSSADGTTVLPVCANETEHSLKCTLGGVGVVHPTVNDPRDKNRKVAFMAVSSVDGVTPVAVYVDPITNKILISQ